jgi:hypothetical protein
MRGEPVGAAFAAGSGAGGDQPADAAAVGGAAAGGHDSTRLGRLPLTGGSADGVLASDALAPLQLELRRARGP